MERLRIGVVSNLYPPAVVGGYEIGCARIVEQLRERGHDVHVLTSKWRANTAPASPEVSRQLPIAARDEGEMGLSDATVPKLARLADELASQRALRRLVRQHRPDVVYFFNTRFISRSLIALAAKRVPVVLYVSDPWFADARLEDLWVSPWERSRAAAHAARLLVDVDAARQRIDDLASITVQFTSAALRDDARAAGRQVDGAEVIHWGVDPARFVATRAPVAPRRFLFVGQVLAHKGVATALRAFADLCERVPGFDGTFTVAGDTTWPAYRTQLEQFVGQRGISDRVQFLGRVAAGDMPALYADHDALVFPSEWEEPFSITLVEAMAAGLPVVSTLNGGSREIVEPERNALSFAAGDADACSAQMQRLLDPDLAARLGRAARATVEARFTLSGMVGAIETSLRAAAESRARPA